MKTGNKNKFGKWLKEARASAGLSLVGLSEVLKKDYGDGRLSLRELGEISKIDYTMLSKVEQGVRFLSDEKIVCLSRIFDVNPKDLISLKYKDKRTIAVNKLYRTSNRIPGFRPDIEAEVLKLLKIYRYKKNLNNIYYPLDLEDFFKVVFGLETRYESFSEKRLWEEGEEPKLAALFVKSETITINTDPIGGRPLPRESQRFSLAHEGAHFIRSIRMGEAPTQPIFFRKKQLRNVEEAVVDYWAGALLMPKPELTDKIEKFSEQKINLNFVADLSEIGKRLCKYFGASRQALEIRLRQIGIKSKNTLYGR